MIAMHDKGLADRIELVWTRTRQHNDPILAVNPSGRVPFLMLDDGTGMEDTDLIVDYLDALVPPRKYGVPHGEGYWRFRRLEATARSILDGGSVWAREIKRPVAEQSSEIIEHERRRAVRMSEYFENEIQNEVFQGELNKPQLLLFCALDLERRVPGFDWRAKCPRLREWFRRLEVSKAVAASLPPIGV